MTHLFSVVGCDAAVQLFSALFVLFNDFTREPLCVNLQSINLARDIQRLVQGTNLKVTKKGCCWWDQLVC